MLKPVFSKVSRSFQGFNNIRTLLRYLKPKHVTPSATWGTANGLCTSLGDRCSVVGESIDIHEVWELHPFTSQEGGMLVDCGVKTATTTTTTATTNTPTTATTTTTTTTATATATATCYYSCSCC